MLLKIICVILLVVNVGVGAYHEYEDASYVDDSYGNYEDDNEISNSLEHKRFERPTVKTLSPQEVQEVRGAIKEILSGRKLENPFTPLPSVNQDSSEKRSFKRAIVKANKVGPSYNNILRDKIKSKINKVDDDQESRTTTYELFSTNDFLKPLDTPTDGYQTDLDNDIIGATVSTYPRRSSWSDLYRPQLRTDENLQNIDQETTPHSEPVATPLNPDEAGANEEALEEPPDAGEEPPADPGGAGDAEEPAGGAAEEPSGGANEDSVEGGAAEEPSGAVDKDPSEEGGGDSGDSSPVALSATLEALNDEVTTLAPVISTTAAANFRVTTSQTTLAPTTLAPTTVTTTLATTTTEPTTTTTTKRRTRRTTTKFQLDVPALLEIIANLTYDYEMNLTDNLNETLIRLSIPTCPTPTTTPEPRGGIDYDANATGIVIAKCFVCGLDVEQIPHNAHCADAFAGDFLPLVPVDMTARGHISNYRKYCRYLDVNHYVVNASQPRSVYGRWTGGCSVRWIDLSGVYTQRTCRNKERAVMGKHFASKRMAKLEMALGHLDNGCIASPMATLVPLSRGISLYARFHACVCMGSWCNVAAARVPWIGNLLTPVLVGFVSPYLLFT